MEDFNGIFRKYKKEKEVEDSDSNKYTELFVMYTSLSSTVLPMIFPDSERFGKIEEVENLKLQNNILLAAALSMGKRAEGGFGSIQKHKQNGKNNRRGEGPIPETDFDAILKKLYNTREMIPDEMVNVLPSLFSKNNVLGYCDKYTKLFVMYTAMSSAILPMIFPDSNRFGKIKEVENLKLQNNILIAAALSMGKRAEGGFGSIPMEYARLEKGKKSVGERIKNNINKKTLLYLFFFIKIIYDFFSQYLNILNKFAHIPIIIELFCFAFYGVFELGFIFEFVLEF